jgi:hypothetical protein
MDALPDQSLKPGMRESKSLDSDLSRRRAWRGAKGNLLPGRLRESEFGPPLARRNPAGLASGGAFCGQAPLLLKAPGFGLSGEPFLLASLRFGLGAGFGGSRFFGQALRFG